jgi:hypothetical protein
MTGLSEACSDLAIWLPRAAALTATPDTAARTRASGKPGSRPPWNPQAAMALLDALAAIADTEALLRLIVTGRPGRRRPASATGAALDAIASLGYAVPPHHARAAERDLVRCAIVIQQLPAVDQEERPLRVAANCPYCQVPMVMLYPQSGRVTCTRHGACFDGDGRHPVGTVENGRLGPCVIWADGLVT